MIVVFDGECLLCSRSVQFLLAHDRRRVFRFASIQSDVGRALLADAGLTPDGLQTLLLVDGARHYRHSGALLQIVGQLGWPWRLLRIARVIPPPLRDWAYRLGARNRYRWFGRREQCFLPTPGDRDRFL